MIRRHMDPDCRAEIAKLLTLRAQLNALLEDQRQYDNAVALRSSFLRGAEANRDRYVGEAEKAELELEELVGEREKVEEKDKELWRNLNNLASLSTNLVVAMQKADADRQKIRQDVLDHYRDGNCQTTEVLKPEQGVRDIIREVNRPAEWRRILYKSNVLQLPNFLLFILPFLTYSSRVTLQLVCRSFFGLISTWTPRVSFLCKPVKFTPRKESRFVFQLAVTGCPSFSQPEAFGTVFITPDGNSRLHFKFAGRELMVRSVPPKKRARRFKTSSSLTVKTERIVDLSVGYSTVYMLSAAEVAMFQQEEALLELTLHVTPSLLEPN
ncbi:hypothetical protein Pelo_7816 [Pelomyxa schiedti]|nr:hypothetical protein Pelo_7816 [Pelomyxa schiedti]